MPYKDREKQLEAQRRHYRENKEQYKNRCDKRRKIAREFVQSLKTGGCSRCGYNEYTGCLDFHHKDKKKDKWSNLKRAADDLWGEEKILEEVKKCILLCANCHRLEHAKL